MPISKLVTGMIVGIIGLVIVITVLSQTVTQVADAGDLVNATGLRC